MSLETAVSQFRESAPESKELRDAADEIFNQWYDRAKAYAGGTRSDDDKKAIVEDTVLALKTLFGSYGHVLERRADGWIEEICLQHAGNIFKVFKTKPKFTELVERDAPFREPFWEVIRNEGLPRLQNAAIASGGFTWERRKRVLDTLESLFHLARSLFAEGNTHGTTVSKFPFTIDVAKLCSIVVENDDVGLLQDASLRTLGAIAGENGHGYAPMVAFHLLKIAKDSKTLVAAWNMGGLVEEKCVELILGRLSNARKINHNVMMDLYKLLKGDSKSSEGKKPFACATKQGVALEQRGFVNQVIVSLYEALVDSKSHASKINARTATLADSERAFPSLVTLAAATDVVLPVATAIVSGLTKGEDATVLSPEELNRLEDPEHSWERSDSWLDLSRSVLQNFPGNPEMLALLLSHPTLNSVNLLISLSATFNERMWLGTLFPFIRFSLRHMGSAVSGKQWDQDVVKLLREAIRTFYLAGDVKIDPDVRDNFGYSLFYTILLAITSGYSEQERFTEYGARILRWHAFEHYKLSSTDEVEAIKPWIKLSLSDDICQRSHRNERAIMELLMISLGVESSAWGVEESKDDLPERVSNTILRCLARTQTEASYQFWRELVLNHGSFIQKHPHVGVGELVRSTERRVFASLQKYFGRQEGGDLKGETPLTVLELQHLLLLFNELAAAITPDNAAAAFDTMLKILILLSKNSGKDVTVIVAGTSDPQDLNSLEGIHSDESMAAIIEKIPSVSQIPDPLVVECTKICGPLSRAALATLSPGHFLTDNVPFVRRAALLAMANCNLSGHRNTWALLPPGIEIATNMSPQDAGGVYDPFTVARLMQAVRADTAKADSFLLQCDMIYQNLSPFRNSDEVYIPPSELNVHEVSLYNDSALALANVAIAVANSPALFSERVMGGSQYVVAVLVGCLSRLIRGAELSREISPESKPGQIYDNCLSHIASSSPLHVLTSLATSSYGLKRLGKLAKLSSQWAGLINGWERAGVIKRSLMGVKEGTRTADDEQFTNILPRDGPSNVTGEMLVDLYGDAQSILNHMVNAKANQQWLSALHYAISLQKVDPSAFDSNSCQSMIQSELLPRIAEESFDQPIDDFQRSPTSLAAAQRQYQLSTQTAQDLNTLLGSDYVEKTLHLADKLENLQIAIVNSLLKKGETEDARKFMRQNGIRNPRISAAIDSNSMNRRQAKVTSVVKSAYKPALIPARDAERTQNSIYPSASAASSDEAEDPPIPSAPPVEDQAEVWREVSKLNLR